MIKIYLNGKDISTEYNAKALEGTEGAICSPAKMKDYVSNENEALDGKVILGGYARVRSRDFTIPIKVAGSTATDYYTNKDKLENDLMTLGLTTLRVARIDGDTTVFDKTLSVVYKDCTEYINYNGKWGTLMLVFEEPNPKNRVNNKEE